MEPRIKKSQLALYMLIFIAAPLLTFRLGLFLDLILNLPKFPHFPFNIFLGMTVMIIGLNLGIKSTRQLYHTGLVLPWGETTREVETQRIVVTGIYAYSRNPIVLGYSILPLGMGLMFQSIGMMLSLTPAVLLINIIIVKIYEEPRLVERFGSEYISYKERTPFLFPSLINLFQEFIVPYVKAHRDQLTYVILAELSLFVTSFLVLHDLPPVFFPLQNSFSGLIFAAICIFGILAGVAPKRCAFTSKSERRGSDGVIGHHPDCGHFPGHTVTLGTRVFCAGCSGLVLGAGTSLLGLFLCLRGFLFCGYSLDVFVVFWFGVLLVCLGLAQHFIDLGSGWVHFWLNFFFVVGTWFMFVAIQLMKLSFLVSAYFLAVTVFWILARIRASQWTHVAVCSVCNEKCIHSFE